MKKEQLYKVLGDINENYINDAHKTVKKNSRPVWVKWGAMAACLCLVVVGAFIAPNITDNAQDYVETVIYNGAEYAVCGTGEVSILEDCGLPTEITKDLAGEHLGCLEQSEKNTYYVSEGAVSGNVKLFEYGPQPNNNVFILYVDGEYYAVIRRDSEGYHGLTDNAPTDVLPFAKVKECTQEILDECLIGISREDIVSVWGEPDGQLSGFWGDTWQLDNEKGEHIIVYYDKDGIVEHIKISDLSD